MEALALGRPVIATRIAGIGELVEHERNGWLIDAGSIESLTEALAAAAEAPVERLEAMGRAGRRRVREQHDSAREVDRLAGHIRSCIEHGKPAPESAAVTASTTPSGEPQPA